ncbi:hypothetical protein J3R74_000803 [Puniceicoccus vermicola]
MNPAIQTEYQQDGRIVLTEAPRYRRKGILSGLRVLRSSTTLRVVSLSNDERMPFMSASPLLSRVARRAKQVSGFAASRETFSYSVSNKMRMQPGISRLPCA